MTPLHEAQLGLTSGGRIVRARVLFGSYERQQRDITNISTTGLSQFDVPVDAPITRHLYTARDAQLSTNHRMFVRTNPYKKSASRRASAAKSSSRLLLRQAARGAVRDVALLVPVDDDQAGDERAAVVAGADRPVQPVDFLIMPNATHSFGNDPYFVRRRWDYFVQHLLAVQSPAGFRIGAPPAPATSAAGTRTASR